LNGDTEGEIVRKLKPVFEYLHRNHEKMAECASYLGSIPYTDQLDCFCSMTITYTEKARQVYRDVANISLITSATFRCVSGRAEKREGAGRSLETPLSAISNSN
jgi:hypothetical protein